MSDLLNWLLKKENKTSCRILGIFCVTLPLIFFFGGGFKQSADGEGIIFSSCWFREVFLVTISLLFLVGVILIIAGFSKKESE